MKNICQILIWITIVCQLFFSGKKMVSIKKWLIQLVTQLHRGLSYRQSLYFSEQCFMTVFHFVTQNISNMYLLKAQGITKWSLPLLHQEYPQTNRFPPPHNKCAAMKTTVTTRPIRCHCLDAYSGITVLSIIVFATSLKMSTHLTHIMSWCENSFDLKESLKGLKDPLGSAVYTSEPLIQTHKFHVRHKQMTASNGALSLLLWDARCERNHHGIVLFSFLTGPGHKSSSLVPAGFKLKQYGEQDHYRLNQQFFGKKSSR